MPNKAYAILAVSLAVLLISPVFADVFVPPGPVGLGGGAAFISPTLSVYKISGSTYTPIGWQYTDGFTYNPLTGQAKAQTDMEDPTVVGATDIPYGTSVLILGYVPGVTVAVDQVPPPVELKITWNGMPNTITLTVPSSQVVGINFPPTIYADQSGPYQMAYPTTPKQTATWNLWAGDWAYVAAKFGLGATPPVWWETQFGKTYGEFFWYKFTPNVGDWIAYDSVGQTKFPPTYDITALFEYGTSQIWFNHVCFDVSMLELHKDVSWCGSQEINDVVTITNVGLVTATGLDFTQTFPSTTKLSLVPDPAFGAMAWVTDKTGAVVIPSQPLVGFIPGAEAPNNLVLPAPFNTLPAGSTLTINVLIDVLDVGSTFSGTIVFDSMCSATQIPAWKDPIGLAGILYNAAPDAKPDSYLWSGYVLGSSTLWGEPKGHTDFDLLNVFPVYTANILRVPLTHAAIAMTLDPLPVPLIAGETAVTSADVALVRNAVVGLGAYDQRMDCNGNGRVDVSDLAAYEAAVS